MSTWPPCYTHTQLHPAVTKSETEINSPVFGTLWEVNFWHYSTVYQINLHIYCLFRSA